jgi:hypothetical protein
MAKSLLVACLTIAGAMDNGKKTCRAGMNLISNSKVDSASK